MIYADVRDELSMRKNNDNIVLDSNIFMVLLSELRPREGFQLLGVVESRGTTRWASDDKLRLQSAKMGGDAVVDVRRERINGSFKWLSTGTAIKVSSQSIYRELKDQVLESEIAHLGFFLMLFVVAHLAFYATSSIVAAGLLGSPLARPILAFTATHCWPLLATALLWRSKQYMRPPPRFRWFPLEEQVQLVY